LEAALRYAAEAVLTFTARLHLMHLPGKMSEHMDAALRVGQFDGVPYHFVPSWNSAACALRARFTSAHW